MEDKNENRPQSIRFKFFLSLSHAIYPTTSIQTIIQIMNILSVFVSFAILLKCVAASGDTLGVGFKEAVDGRNFGWLKANWERWRDRKDLLDDVIAKGADFAVRFIQNVEGAKRRVLAALFDKGEGMIDGVLGRIKYDDDDLII